MSVTRDTSHCEISPLNDATPIKMALISVTLDTSHPPICPCGPGEQPPLGDSLRQVSMALCNSAFDCGENENSLLHEFGDMKTRSSKRTTWRCGGETTMCARQCTAWHCLCVCVHVYDHLFESMTVYEYMTSLHLQLAFKVIQ